MVYFCRFACCNSNRGDAWDKPASGRSPRSEKILREGLLRLSKENFNAGHMPPYQFLIRRGPDVYWYSSDV